jgi:ligand-binding sensor domain-containing protein/signal transduction histidine kinase
MIMAIKSTGTGGKSGWRKLFGCWLLAVFAQMGVAAVPSLAPAVPIPAAATPFSFAEPYFESVGDAESIPGGSVLALVQDSKGLLWIGTQHGLIRYDGYRFRKFSHITGDPVSLAGDFILSLWSGTDDRLWIGTANDGLSVFDADSERFENYRHDPKQSNSISGGKIWAITGDAAGGVWVGTDQGLDYLAPGAKVFTHYRHNLLDPASLVDDRVRSLLLDAHGRLWVCTMIGLQRLRRNGKGFDLIASDPADPASLAGQDVRALFEAADGKLWLGTASQGAAWLQPDTFQLHRLAVDPARADRLSHGWIKAIKQPQADQIWLATYGGGINVVDAADGRVVQRLRHDASVASSLALDQMGAMLVDRSGLLWAGSWGAGLQRYNTRNHTFKVLRHSPVRPLGLSYADVRSVLELADGKILVGTGGNGIDIIDRQQGLIGGYRPEPGKPGGLADGFISALAQTSDGVLWAGTQQTGVMRRAPGADHWQGLGMAQGLPASQVRRLLAGRDGVLWAGTASGLARWQARTQRFEVIPALDGTPMRSFCEVLAEDAQGRIWAGGREGLWVLDPGSKGLRPIRHDAALADSISGNGVHGLLSDSHNRLWASTEYGLDRLRSWDGKRAVFEHIGALAGLPGRNLGANLQEDQMGRIWTGEFVVDTRHSLHLDALTKADGLDIGSSWNGSYAHTRDGLLLHGGTQGLVIIDPAQFFAWNYQPPVHATELMIDGMPFALGALAPGPGLPLTLNPGQRKFSIEFAALDYSAPQKNRYAYRLEGYDKDWIDTDAGHRSANYGNLWPGLYTLQVRGTNREGDWSTRQLMIAIQVLPAFWQTGWFLALMLLLLGSAIYAGYHWRLARLREQAQDLQKLIDARTADILKLGEIGKELTSTLDIEQAFERVWKQVSARLDAHVFAIGIYQKQEAGIVFVYAIKAGQRQTNTTMAMLEHNQPAVWCMRERSELIIATHSGLTNYVGAILPSSSGVLMETVVYLPLMVEQRVIGCLTVQSPQPHAYSGGQLEFLRVLASYTAIALSNSGAHTELAKSHSKLAESHGKLAESHQHLKETQTKLIQSEKMASLGGLVTGIAHEINTPLGTALMAISGAAGALQELKTAISGNRLSRSLLDTSVGGAIEYTDLALRTGARAAELITTFKAIAVRVDNDQRMEIDLAVFLREMAGLIKAQLELTGSRLMISVEPGLRLYIVQDALMEAITRVLANVIDHAFVDGRTGLLHLRARAGQNDDVIIDISDTGHGIAPDDLPKVFDPFFTTKSGIRGHVGLGLHVAFNHVTQRLRGEISIASAVEQGTTVTIRLRSDA